MYCNIETSLKDHSQTNMYGITESSLKNPSKTHAALHTPFLLRIAAHTIYSVESPSESMQPRGHPSSNNGESWATCRRHTVVASAAAAAIMPAGAKLSQASLGIKEPKGAC